MNKHSISVVTLAIFALVAVTSNAGEVTGLTSFSPGQQLSSTDMNANFAALQTEVNDNDTRISSISVVPGTVGVVGTQQLVSTSPILIDSTISSAVTIATVTISTTDTINVALSAHAFAIVATSNNGQYGFVLRRTDCSGTMVGFAGWQPPGTSTDVGTTIALTGLDMAVTGPVTYALCGYKGDAGATAASVYQYGLNAVY